ncbi:hypothetical protein [Mangrovivirga cuniculi]|uniref:Uncharacterized protein n=1 Tax=Mangrovivirga cuniculi TaxID=2715131 RepID=A0A4D7JY67_9BACT|nr:hypothetical protein [Mangrovivirga cuniculi]QCK15645.1 hypothetical protein DCC35_13275 [Mangrovivirga cuniculi]
MNWKKIHENWNLFVRKYNLKDESKENNYFYGKQELYRASEVFEGFNIYYENKFNKSAEIGSSFRVGNRLAIVSPIEASHKWTLKVEKNSLWKRLFNSSDKSKIEFSDPEIKEYLPLEEIKNIATFFPDLRLSVKEFNKHQNQYIKYGQNVFMIQTKYQPKELEYLTKPREVMISVLQKLKENEFINSI